MLTAKQPYAGGTGTLATLDELGAGVCSPPCSDPTTLANVSLCVLAPEAAPSF